MKAGNILYCIKNAHSLTKGNSYRVVFVCDSYFNVKGNKDTVCFSLNSSDWDYYLFDINLRSIKFKKVK